MGNSTEKRNSTNWEKGWNKSISRWEMWRESRISCTQFLVQRDVANSDWGAIPQDVSTAKSSRRRRRGLSKGWTLNYYSWLKFIVMLLWNPLPYPLFLGDQLSFNPFPSASPLPICPPPGYVWRNANTHCSSFRRRFPGNPPSPAYQFTYHFSSQKSPFAHNIIILIEQWR